MFNIAIEDGLIAIKLLLAFAFDLYSSTELLPSTSDFHSVIADNL